MKFEPDRVRGWIEAQDIDALAQYLMSGTHHGKPGAPQVVKLGVIGLLRECSPARQLAWGKKLMKTFSIETVANASFAQWEKRARICLASR